MTLTTLTQRVKQDPNFTQLAQAFEQDQNLTTAHYQRNWDETIPTYPLAYVIAGTPADYISGAAHITGLALPFIGILHQPASRAISFGSDIWNLGDHFIGLITRPSEIRQHIWGIAKAGAELIGTLKGLKTGLVIHTAMDIVENLADCRTIKKSDIPAKIDSIVSNCLYLITLLAFSQRAVYAARAASLAFQAVHVFFKAFTGHGTSKKWASMKTLDTAAYTVLTAIYATKAYSAYQEYQKLQKVVQEVVGRMFVLMRPASKRDKTEDGTGGVTANGLGRAEKAAVGIERIQEEFAKNGVIIVTSTDPHHAQTGQIIGDKVKAIQVTQDGELRERTATGWLVIEDSEVRRADPGYIQFNGLSNAEKWVTRPTPETESQKELFERLDAAVRKILAENPDPNKLLVIVSGGTIIQDWVKGVRLLNPDQIPEAAAKRFKDAEQMIVQMAPDKDGKLQVSRLDRTQRVPSPRLDVVRTTNEDESVD
jgi:broad specificity phosphatase PhoE